MSGQHCESYDVKRETVHYYPVNSSLLTAVSRDGWNLSAVFKFCFCFVLLFNKSLNDWSLGEQNFVSGNIEIFGKQNSLFPSGPVIKCLIYPGRDTFEFRIRGTWPKINPSQCSFVEFVECHFEWKSCYITNFNWSLMWIQDVSLVGGCNNDSVTAEIERINHKKMIFVEL